MNPLIPAFAAGALALCAGQPASAATLIAEATEVNSLMSSFRIGFLDGNGNGRVEFGEITAFSGVTQGESDLYPAVQSLLLAMPQIDGYTVAGGRPGIDLSGNLWVFSAAGPTQPQTFGPVVGWVYAIDPSPDLVVRPPSPAPIPLPAPGLLLAAALAGGAAASRRRVAAEALPCAGAGPSGSSGAQPSGRMMPGASGGAEAAS